MLPIAKKIVVGYHPDNLEAHHLYTSLGTDLIKELPNEVSIHFCETIRRIAEKPTKPEIQEDNHMLARDTLHML